jgi:hypothetical protein
MVHRTGTVHCPVHLLAPALTLRELSVHCRFSGFCWSRPLRCSRKPLLRWHTGQSGVTPDSPVNYGGVAIPEIRS